MKQEDSFADQDPGDRTDLFSPVHPSDLQGYRARQNNSIEHREEYWRRQAGRLKWDTPFTTVVEEDFLQAKISWFAGGKLNPCRNALDMNVENGGASKHALVYFSGGKMVSNHSFREIDEQVTLLARALVTEGFGEHDVVALYLPDCPETVLFMLACARLGITCVPVPHRFTSEITVEIVNDCKASMLVVALDSDRDAYRERAGDLIKKVSGITAVTTGDTVKEPAVPYAELCRKGAAVATGDSTSVDSEHPLFIVYAHSATGIPRGSVFAAGGFLVQAAASFDAIFRADSSPGGGESILCTLDLASVAGQSYGLWGPLLNGVTVVISAEGEEMTAAHLREVLTVYPHASLLTSPRMIAAMRDELKGRKLSDQGAFSLVASCGDTITPRFVSFAGEALASGQERVLNLWIQSESGASVINTYPKAELNQPGSLGLPFPGVQALAVNNVGEPCRPNESGQLVFECSWPSMIRTIWGQAQRFNELYFRRIPGYYSTNDGVRIDPEGFFWFMGRLDDVIKVRGQSLATSEIEAVLVTHPDVTEAAVVSLGGEDDNLHAFLVIEGSKSDREKENLKAELTKYVAHRIGEFAAPRHVIFTPELPKTKTGKIVRRILRRAAAGDISSDEDMSHVANPESIQQLIRKEES